MKLIPLDDHEANEKERLRVVEVAGIGVHPLGYRHPAEMSTLTGAEARRALSLDLRSFAAGESGKSVVRAKKLIKAYIRVVELALDLHPLSVLANSGNSGNEYSISNRDNNGEEAWNHGFFHIDHRVVLPHLDGGFLEVGIALNGGLSNMWIDVSSRLEYLGSDPVGLAADGLDREETVNWHLRNIHSYLSNAALQITDPKEEPYAPGPIKDQVTRPI